MSACVSFHTQLDKAFMKWKKKCPINFKVLAQDSTGMSTRWTHGTKKMFDNFKGNYNDGNEHLDFL